MLIYIDRRTHIPRYVYTHTYIYIYVDTHMYKECMHVCMYVCMHIYTFICMYVCIYLNSCSCFEKLFTCTYVYVRSAHMPHSNAFAGPIARFVVVRS